MVPGITMHRLLRFPNWLKMGILFLSDYFLIAVAAVFALTLHTGRFGPFGAEAARPYIADGAIRYFWDHFLPSFFVEGHFAKLFLFLLPPLIVMGGFALFGVYRAVLRYFDARLVPAIVKGAALGAVTWASIGLIWIAWTDLLAIGLVFLGGTILATTGSRAIFARLVRVDQTSAPRSRVVIYGAGEAGTQLLSVLVRDQAYDPIAFVDDDVELHGRSIQSRPVFPAEALPGIVRAYSVRVVVLAVPRAARDARRRIIDRLEGLPVKVLTLPPLADMLSGRVGIADVRNVDVEDLLNRQSATPVAALLEHDIKGRTVMVTGGGGSIGSELCRQIVPLGPTRLIVVDMSEIAIYNAERDLAPLAGREGSKVDLVSRLASVGDRAAMEKIFSEYEIDTVYHAAAYKHVPIVEENCVSGILNNIFGTLNVARLAEAHRVKKFVLISTDKAVRSRNVMGATKRVAELVVRQLGEQKGPTCFTMVRFGNVLRSAGSVIPRFERQISDGGPVTVTDPEVTRYFMTIHEAAQLVIQAGAMAEGGDIFVLDMGEPVNILRCAEKLIRLRGFTVRNEANPNGDIAIEIIGLRPGEKLHEELVADGRVLPTAHPQISRLIEDEWGPWERLQSQLAALEGACLVQDRARAVTVLGRIVEGEMEALETMAREPQAAVGAD